MAIQSESGKTISHGARNWALIMLIIVYTFNFIDRQILSVLAVPIKEEFGLSDQALGWLMGPAFALFYTVLGIPIALLADRRSRIWIMTAALTLWSGFTALCGVAGNYTQLFLFRMGVGVGEAGGVAPAYSLLTDYYPPQKRARAMSAYSFGIPIGSAVGIIMGGVLADLLSWRAAFIIIGLLGVAVAPLFRLTLRDPKRGQFDVQKESHRHSTISETFETLVKKPSFWLLCIGAASSSMMGYGLFAWLPSFLVRSFEAELPAFMSFVPGFLLPENPSTLLLAAYYYGTIVLVGGILGIWMGGVLADKYGPDNKRAYPLVPAIAFLITVPAFIIGILSQSLLISFFVFLIPTALGLVWLGPVITAIQHTVPASMRATASAIFLFINNLIGIGLGNLVIGMISDGYRDAFGDESLRYALFTGVIFYLMAAGFLYLASRFIVRDWVD